ncbi:tetratricopeptide repeat protein [candidate division KSB1 bacterium]|nr:tetratricopeptide repeat protein [candidate division KSB1 bacterium]
MARNLMAIKIFTFILCMANAGAQDAALTLANKYLAGGNYDAAITEFKRFLCFNIEHEAVSDIYYEIGLAYRNQKKWASAIEALRQSMVYAENDSVKQERRISIAIIQLGTANYSAAEFELLRIAHFSDYPGMKSNALYFLGVCYCYLASWQQAQQAFDEYFKQNPSAAQHAIDSLFASTRDLNYKSPVLARWLSTFLPGSGQIYAGDWRNGFNAMILNSITGYYLIQSLIEQRIKDALIGHLTLFERYYRGNRHNAAHAATLHNQKIDEKLSRNILDRLSKTE